MALIYTLINSEVQREMFRSLDRCLIHRTSSWQQSNYFRNYMNKLDNDRLCSVGYHARSAPVQYRHPSQLTGIVHYYRCTNQHKFSVSNPSRQDSLNAAAAIAQELSLFQSPPIHRPSLVNIQNNHLYVIQP